MTTFEARPEKARKEIGDVITRISRTAFLLAAVAPLALAAEEINPYNGRQVREETFEFAEKPTVEKRGAKYVIRFASRDACDATVAIMDKDGKIVRHLASGVLGPNAPWPFRQDSLAQQIEWDGKDDEGRPAPPGCRVKVGLGLTARLDRFLGWQPDAMLIKEANGLAVGPRGNLFVLTGGHEGSGLPASSPHVYVFDSSGTYQRTILPPNASMPAERATFMNWAKTATGKDVPARQMSYIMNTICQNRHWADTSSQAPVVTADGRFVFLVDGRDSRSLVMVDVRDGATPPGSIVEVEKSPADALFDGPVYMALSPDGSWLYLSSAFSSPQSRGGRKKTEPGHCVFRMSMREPGPPDLLVGELGKPGKDNAHLNRPAGLACDKSGRLYVADYENGRIQVFKPDGTHTKTVEIENPRVIVVHPRTGEIYVIQAEHRSWTLVKLGSLDDPAIKASLSLSWGHTPPALALDATHSPPVLWSARQQWKRSAEIVRIEDRGSELLETPGGVVKQVEGWEWWRGWAHSTCLAASRTRDELMLRDTFMVRLDGRSGEIIEEVFEQSHSPVRNWFGATFVVAGPRGRYWMQLQRQLGTKEMHVVCYDPDQGQFVSLPHGSPLPEATYKDAPLVGITSWHAAAGRNFPDIMGVAPNGDLYIPFGITPEVKDELSRAGFEPPSEESRMYHGAPMGSLLRVYSSDGKLKCPNALPGLGPSNGIRIGRTGAVYIVLACQPVGQNAPEGLAPDVAWDRHIWGTLVKFDSSFDKFPIGKLAGRWEGEEPEDPTHVYSRTGPTRIENMLWDYAGVSPQPMGGGMACCTCWRSCFDLDGFERSFVPASHTCTVNVLDANGNIVMRIGGYGNADSRGKQSPVPDPKTGEYRPRRPEDPKNLKSPLAEPEIAFLEPAVTAVTGNALYVHDRGNERIVRAVLDYHAVATVPLP